MSNLYAVFSYHNSKFLLYCQTPVLKSGLVTQKKFKLLSVHKSPKLNSKRSPDRWLTYLEFVQATATVEQAAAV